MVKTLKPAAGDARSPRRRPLHRRGYEPARDAAFSHPLRGAPLGEKEVDR